MPTEKWSQNLWKWQLVARQKRVRALSSWSDKVAKAMEGSISKRKTINRLHWKQEILESVA